MEYFKKNWLVILIGCLSAVLGVLTLLTVVKLKKTTPVAPSVPQKKPEAITQACTLTFRLTLKETPTPTASPSPSPTGLLTPTPTEETLPTATPSATPTITPTSKPNEPPICTGLSASPTSGKAPLTVALTGNGVDLDGKITAFEFMFGDGETKIVEKDVEGPASHSLEHPYPAGSYWASLRIKDNNNVWSEIPESCKVKIEVEESAVGGQESSPTPGGPSLTPTPTKTLKEITQTPTATSTAIPVPEVPEAGIALPTILTIISGTLLILFGLLL